MSNTVFGIALCVLFDLSGSRDVISIQSRDHLIPRRPFPIGGPVEPRLYLQRFPIYSTLNDDRQKDVSLYAYYCSISAMA